MINIITFNTKKSHPNVTANVRLPVTLSDKNMWHFQEKWCTNNFSDMTMTRNEHTEKKRNIFHKRNKTYKRHCESKSVTVRMTFVRMRRFMIAIAWSSLAAPDDAVHSHILPVKIWKWIISKRLPRSFFVPFHRTKFSLVLMFSIVFRLFCRWGESGLQKRL